MCAFCQYIYRDLAGAVNSGSCWQSIMADGDGVSRQALTVTSPSRQMLLGERVLTWRIGDIL